MTEEDERNNNGGANPSGTEEYREGDRYSVHFVPGDPAGVGEKADAETGGDMASTRARLSRQQLEGMYRNDPRFEMLFTRSIAKKKDTHYIKVGGIRLTPKRILILCGFLLIFLLCLAGSVFYAIRDIGKYRNFSQAMSLLEAGDYESAKTLLLKVLAADPNKEAAIGGMARIYHDNGDWGNEAFFRQRLMRLNPLNEELYRDFLDTSFRARNFGSIYSILNLKVMDDPELPPDEGALYVIAALHSAHAQNAKTFFNAMTKEHADYFSGTERGRYAEILLNAADMKPEDARKYLASLKDIRDPQVRFETINTLVTFFSKQGDRESDEQVEKLLLESVELNEFAGAPILASYYFNRYRFKDTMGVCERYFNTLMNAVMPILYGDSCLLSGQAEMIPPFADRMRRLRGRQSLVLASYLDALHAFAENDEARLRDSMMIAGATIRTPLSALMKFQLAVLADSPKEVLLLLGEIMNGRPFLDFKKRAGDAALEYLTYAADSGLTSDPDRLTAYAGIAELIRTPGEESPFLTRIIVFDRFKRNVLRTEELQTAMRDYPGDPVLLRIAAEYYLVQRQPARAMDCISEYNSLEIEGKEPLAILHVLALDQLGRKEEAEKEFRTIVERDEDSTLFYSYFDFCVENGLFESLKSLSAWLESLPKDSARRAALPFVRAEILLSEGEKDQAIGLFEKTASDDPQFVFHAAKRLAESGRADAAFKRYLSIKDTYPDKALLNINLSELYSETGDAKNALECARIAWEDDRNNLLTRYVYGKCLCDAGQYADALAVLRFPLYRASFPKEMLDLWTKAIREQIKSDFNAARYIPAMENAKHLLIYYPEDVSAQDYIEKIQKLRRHENTGTDSQAD